MEVKNYVWNWLRVLKVVVVIIQKVIHYSKRNLLWNKKYYIVHKENRDVMQNEIYYAKRNKHAKVSKEKSTV